MWCLKNRRSQIWENLVEVKGTEMHLTGRTMPMSAPVKALGSVLLGTQMFPISILCSGYRNLERVLLLP